MIERVHEHLTSELRQNARTDTIFVITAILLSLVILAVNSVFAGNEGYYYDPAPTLTEGNHTLFIEVTGEDGWEWHSVGEVEIIISQGSSGGGSIGGTPLELDLPDKPRDIRYQLDSQDESGWAIASEVATRDSTDTMVMFVFMVLQVFVIAAVILGLLKGKRMRLVILDGVLRMYKDQNVETYYSESLLKSYSVRYYIFISIVVLIGIISIIVPLIVRYL